MARINIEDSLLHDPRMAFVIRKIGQRLAVGTWYEIARCAQKYWLDGRKPIPESVWDLLEIDSSFVESGLVEKTKSGYYLKGSDDFFAWIIAQRENGKKGGRPKKQALTETHGKPTAKPIKATENPLTLTLTPTLTLDNNNTYPADEIHPWISTYQEITGKRDGNTAPARKLVQARIKQGFTLEDCSLVVGFKNRQWRNDAKMKQYIKPTTLFSGKFEVYLDEAKNRGEDEIESEIDAMIKAAGIKLED